jgi:hypothetical protein
MPKQSKHNNLQNQLVHNLNDKKVLMVLLALIGLYVLNKGVTQIKRNKLKASADVED